MTSVHIYVAALFLSAGLSAALAYWFFRSLPEDPKRWEALPRSVFLGAFLAAVDLGWCVPQSEPVVPDSMKNLVFPLAVVAFFACYFYLDYLFSRAFGGLLILSAHYFLQASFANDAPVRPVISALCLAMGTLGVFLCGKPHWMRDIIRQIIAKRNWRVGAVAIASVYALVFLATGVAMALAA